MQTLKKKEQDHINDYYKDIGQLCPTKKCKNYLKKYFRREVFSVTCKTSTWRSCS